MVCPIPNEKNHRPKICAMKNFYSLLIAVVAAIVLPTYKAVAQCGGGYTNAQLNWDNLDYITSSGNYSGWVSAARAATQRFAIGTNGVTIAYTGSITNNGETSSHSADAGDDVEYSAVSTSGQTATITLIFDDPVTNPRFSIYDIDRRQVVAVNGKDVSAADLITTIVKRNVGSPVLTLTPITGIGANPSASSLNSSVASSSNDGTIDVTMIGLVKTITLSISNTGDVSSPLLFISDITACVTGAFVNNWRNISRPFTGMPSYILTVRNNVFYQLNPVTGRADSLFTDAGHTNMNAMSYDPVNRYVYYGYSLTGTPSTTRTIYRYSIDNNTITTFIADVNAGVAAIPSYEPGVTSGSASFYNGAMYLGLESSNSSRTTGRENTVWRIDLDASQNPTRATQIYATRSDSSIAGNDVLIHDWSDIGISNNGMLYDFDGARNDSMYYHYDMMTGQRVQFAPSGAGNIGPKQVGIDWQENIYNMGGLPTDAASALNIGGYVVPYNLNGTVNNAQNQLTFTMPGPLYPTGSWGDCGEAYRPYCDFGDAPATYDPDPLSPAVHERDTAIRIGATWDREWSKTSSALANADGADEDGLAYVPILSPTAGNYLTPVSIYNNTGGTATLIAWLDYNANGIFDASEACQAQAVVPSSSSLQNRLLYWPSAPTSLPNGSFTYLRIRLVRTSAGMTNSTPTGYYNHGEAEDYRVLVDNFPLKANLLAFNAKVITSSNVELKWNSSGEEQFRGYEIQRSSADNSSWNVLGFSIATGNGSSDQINYFYNDLRPLAGQSFYRLKLVSNDGKFKYSEVRTITISKGIQEITVLPNPATDKVNLIINTFDNGTAFITVTDMAGRIVHQQTALLQNGSNNTNLPIVDKLNSGMYFIRAEVNGQSVVKKLIIKKE